MFFTKKKSAEVMLVVDIGSNSVGAALVSILGKNPPKVLFSTRLPIALQNESERGHSISGVTVALESVMKTVTAEHVSIHKSHIFFSSPWYSSQTKILKIDHESPVLVTHHIVDQLTKEAEKKIIEESQLKGEVVEHRIIRSRINGYETSNPFNKKAKNLEITFFASIIEKDVLDPIRKIIEKNFHIRNNQISSFSLVAFSTISGIMSDEKDYVIVDLRGGVTDMSLVTEGALIKNLSFPQGKNALAQAVVGNSGQSTVAGLSLLNTVMQGHSEPTVQADVLKSTEAFKQAWIQSYSKTIQELSPVSPQAIFLMADPDVEMFFEKILNEVKNDSKFHSIKYLNVYNFIEKESVATDPFLALESIFVTMI